MSSSKTHKYQEDVFRWCKHLDIPVPIFEFRFDPDRKFRADLAYPSLNLLIEIEGGIFGNKKTGQKYGWHQSIQRMLSDMEKYNLMALRGYYVLRFIPQDIHNGSAFWVIKEFLDGKEGKP